MKKVLKLSGLDCASCAAEVEEVLGKVEGVKSVKVNFIMQKLTLDLDSDNVDNTIVSIKKVIKKSNPTIKVLE